MSIVCLISLLLAGQTPVEPKKYTPPPNWQRAVEINPEPIKCDDKGVEIVTIRMKINKDHFVYATPQPDETFRPTEVRLLAKSKDPNTRVEVTYPKGREISDGPFRWSKYEGDIAIVAIVHRAKGDDSPLECTLRFHPMHKYV